MRSVGVLEIFDEDVLVVDGEGFCWSCYVLIEERILNLWRSLKGRYLR